MPSDSHSISNHSASPPSTDGLQNSLAGAEPIPSHGSCTSQKEAECTSQGSCVVFAPCPREMLAALSICVVLSLIAFIPYHFMFFVFDDIPTLRISVASLGNGFLDAFHPMSNGFWRPLHRLLMMMVTSLFGMSPFALHCLGLTLHVLNGLLLFLFVRMALRMEFWKSLLGCALFQVSTSGILAIIQPGNFADLVALTGLLVAVNAHLLLKGRWGTVAFALGVLIGYLSKEVFVVFPLVLTAIHCSGWGEQNTQVTKVRLVWCCMLSAIYSFMLLLFLSQVETSYATDGRLDLNPVHIVRRFADYLFSLPFPFVHVFEFPFWPIQLSHSFLWLIRFLVILLSCWCIYRAIFGGVEARSVYTATVLIGIFLILPSLIASETASRYLYIPSAFFAVFVVSLLSSARSSFIVLIAFGFLLLAAWFSPTLVGLQRTAAHVEILVQGLEQHKADLPQGASIAILGHPHRAAEPYNWVYRQLIFDVFFPHNEWKYYGDGAMADASVVLQYEEQGQSLEIIELKKAIQRME